jgi:GNAT superfamily N-acetyltransferase
MAMTMKVDKYSKLSEDLRKQVYRNNSRQDGLMRYALKEDEFPIYILHEEGRLVGWAQVTRQLAAPSQPGSLAMFYVKAKHRRKGVAGRLMKRLLKDCRREDLYMHVDSCYNKAGYAVADKFGVSSGD